MGCGQKRNTNYSTRMRMWTDLNKMRFRESINILHEGDCGKIGIDLLNRGTNSVVPRGNSGLLEKKCREMIITLPEGDCGPIGIETL